MIPCGLVLNELISNSLKHAFPGKTKGEIHISFCRENGGKYRLVVEDNGIGMPGDFDLEKAGSLGIRLIYNLVEQLQGNVQIKAEKGTLYEITFSGYGPADRRES
jgi:two-component sensor histidine kinase